MKYFVIGLIFAGIFGTAFGQNIGESSDKIWLPPCPIGTGTECDNSSLFPSPISGPFFHSDSVAVGTIIEKESLDSDSIKFSLSVDFYLKNYQPFDLVTPILIDAPEPQTFPEVFWYNSPVFNEGDLVFAYLEKFEGGYRLLPESFALDKHEARGPPPTIQLVSAPSEDVFEQGEEILISGEIRKMELVKAVKEGKQLDVILRLVESHDRENIVFSDVMEIDHDGNYNYSLNTSEIPPGNYELEVNYGPSTYGNDITITPNFNVWTPLKQFGLGISIEEIQCRENLVLIQKYNGFPACVKPKTIEELIDRNWTTSLIVREIAMKAMSKNLGPECSQHTVHEIQNGIISDNCRNFLAKLSEEHKSEMTDKGYSFDNEQNVWVKDGYPDVMMSIVDFYLQNHKSTKSENPVSKTLDKSWTASYYPGFLLFNSIDSFGKIHSIDLDQNNNVVIGTQIGNHDGVLHYLDNKGNEIWQKKIDRILGSVDISDDGNFITAHGYELTDGGARTFHNHQMIVFDKLGNELWRYPHNFDSDEKKIHYSSFALSSTKKGDLHLIGKGNNTSLLDNNGNKIWESFVSGDSRTSKISQTQRFILIGTENDQDRIDYDWGLTLLDMEGRILWEKSGTDGQIISGNAIAISSNDNFISIGVAPPGDAGILYVFGKNGELMWKETTTSVISFTDFTEDENNLVVITNEELRFYDIDGNLLWTKDIVFRPAMSSYYVAGRSPYEYQDLLRVFDYEGNQVFEYSVNSTISSIKISEDSKLLVVGTQGKTEVGPGMIFYFNQIEG